MDPWTWGGENKEQELLNSGRRIVAHLTQHQQQERTLHHQRHQSPIFFKARTAIFGRSPPSPLLLIVIISGEFSDTRVTRYFFLSPRHRSVVIQFSRFDRWMQKPRRHTLISHITMSRWKKTFSLGALKGSLSLSLSCSPDLAPPSSSYALIAFAYHERKVFWLHTHRFATFFCPLFRRRE